MGIKQVSRSGVSRRTAYGSLDAGGDTTNDIVLIDGDRQVVVAVHPDAISSMKAEYSFSSAAEVNAGTANWFDWVTGTVSDSDFEVLTHPVSAVRITAVTGTGTYEVLA